jgi:hypothetical protein
MAWRCFKNKPRENHKDKEEDEEDDRQQNWTTALERCHAERRKYVGGN